MINIHWELFPYLIIILIWCWYYIMNKFEEPITDFQIILSNILLVIIVMLLILYMLMATVWIYNEIFKYIL